MSKRTHGNEKFFSSRGQTLDEKYEYFAPNYGLCWDEENSWWHLFCYEDTDCEEQEVDASDFEEKMIEGNTKSADLISEKYKSSVTDMRMQEIEQILLESATFRIIHGSLCIWHKNYYKQLDFATFTETVRKILPKQLQEKISRFGRFRETWEYMSSNCELKGGFSDEVVESTKYIIAFRNGFLDVKNMKLFAPNPEYPVLFHIDAKYKPDLMDMPCILDRVISDATDGDSEILTLFYEVLGYICAQGNDAKKFFLFATAPDSGKSIIGEFIGRLLGEENVSTVALNDFGKRFAMGNIANVTLNYNMDLPDETLDKNAVQKIKQLTGDPKIECERKFEQSRTVEHHCKFLFASNHSLKLKADDEAFYNRLILIPFVNSISEEKKDFQLMRKLWNERNIIATKAAYAYKILIAHNFVFTKSEKAERMVSEWRKNADDFYLQTFFQKECRRTNADDFTPTEVIFRAFQEFCRQDGKIVKDSEKIMFSKNFKAQFELNMTKKRVPGYDSPLNGFLGLVLVNDAVNEER